MMRRDQGDERALHLLQDFRREQRAAHDALSVQFPGEKIDLYLNDPEALFENLKVLMYHRLQPFELEAVLRFFKSSRQLDLWKADLSPDDLAKVAEMLRILTEDHGQLASFKSQRPVDRTGAATPWITYPALEFLAQFDYSSARVFEFGVGHSTLFWSKRAREVLAVETDRGWADEVRSKVSGQVDISHFQEADAFVAVLARSGDFDIISIDSAQHRRPAAREALRRLNEGGMIIFDNADWYPKTCDLLSAGGLSRVDFHGFGPLNGYAWTTSLFFKGVPRFPRALAPARPVGGRLVSLSDDGDL